MKNSENNPGGNRDTKAGDPATSGETIPTSGKPSAPELRAHQENSKKQERGEEKRLAEDGDEDNLADIRQNSGADGGVSGSVATKIAVLSGFLGGLSATGQAAVDESAAPVLSETPTPIDEDAQEETSELLPGTQRANSPETLNSEPVEPSISEQFAQEIDIVSDRSSIPIRSSDERPIDGAQSDNQVVENSQRVEVGVTSTPNTEPPVSLEAQPDQGAPELSLRLNATPENARPGDVVAEFSVGAVGPYEISVSEADGSPHPLFMVDGDTIVLRPGANLDFETSPIEEAVVTLTDSLGRTASEVIKIAVDDVAEDLLLANNGVSFTDEGVAETSITGGDGADSIAAHTGGGTLSGGGGDDALIGVAGDDTLSGQLGDDTLDGGQGADTAVWDGDLSDFAVTYDPVSSTFTVTDQNAADGDEGTDSVIDVEDFQFNGVTYSYNDLILDANAAPEIQGFDSLIVNGDFNDALNNWTVNGQVDHGTSSSAVADDDNTYAQLGKGNVAGGDVSQSFATEIGETYTLTFDHAAWQNSNVQSMNVTIAGNTTLLNETVADAPSSTATYNTHSFTFVADSTTTTLTFDDVSASTTGTDGLLDSISVFHTPAVEENAPDGTVVATVSATDADGDALTYALTDGAGNQVTDSNFEIVGNEIRVKSGADLDFEAGESHQLYVTASDAYETSAPQAITVTVTDNADVITLADGGVTFTDTGVAETSIAGGSGNDRITAHDDGGILVGGSGNDTLIGGAGDDLIDGGSGTDTVVFSGNISEYDFVYNADGSISVADTVIGRDGTDIVSNVRWLEFNGESHKLQTFDNGRDSVYLANESTLVFSRGGIDRMHGRNGDDTIFGGKGDDRLYGYNDDDRLFGENGADKLTGGAGDDYIDGGSNYDTAIWHSGLANFNIVYDGDADTFTITDAIGNLGTDTVTNVETFQFNGATYSHAQIVAEADLQANTAPGSPSVASGGAVDENSAAGTVVATLSATDVDGDALTYTLTDSAGTPVTDSNFEIVGNEVRVKSGADLDFEAAQNHEIYVTASDAYETSAPQAITVTVTDEPESIYLGDGGETYVESGGYETEVIGGSGDDTITGGAGNDSLTGDDLGNLVVNGSFEETTGGTVTANSVEMDNVGGWTDANGTVFEQHDSGYHRLDASNGDYWLDMSENGAQMDISQDLSLENGDSFQLVFDAGRINNTSVEMDVYFGGTLIDTIINTQVDEMTTFSYTLEGGSGDGSDTLRFVEVGSSLSVGTALDNVRVFEAGDDTFTGGAGDDTIVGGYGSDTATWSGDLADFSVSFDDASHTFTVIDGNTADGLDEGTDTVTGVESFVFNGSSYSSADLQASIVPETAGSNATHAGTSGDDTLTGTQNGDVMYGLEGSDTIDGDRGDDQIFGGSGNDTIYGGDHQDNITGDAGNDTIYGDDGDDTIDGGTGADVIEGGAGSDRLTGGTGDDTIVMGDGADVVYYALGDGQDTVTGGTNSSWVDTIELDGFTGGATQTAADTVEGQGWTLVLDGGHSFDSVGGSALELSDDASGTITFDDGGIIDFSGIERISL